MQKKHWIGHASTDDASLHDGPEPKSQAAKSEVAMWRAKQRVITALLLVYVNT